MSTTDQSQPAQLAQLLEDAQAGASSARVYRGRSISELLPKIQAELGAEAIVTGRRSGLEGGVAGFFQRRFVELEVQPGTPRLDIRDGEEARPPVFMTPDGAPLEPEGQTRAPTTGETPLHASEDHVRENGFAGALAAADDAFGTGTLAAWPDALDDADALGAVELPLPQLAAAEPENPPVAGAAREHSRLERALVRELQGRGFDEHFATLIVEGAVAHVLPFAPRMGLRAAARQALEGAIPQALPLRASGTAIVLVGPGGAGKSSCAKALASRYRRGATTTVADVSLLAGERGQLSAVVSAHLSKPVDARSKEALAALTVARAQGLAIVDTPAISPSDEPSIRALARVTGAFAPARVVVALPATLSAAAASRLIEALAPLQPSAVAITHADECEQLGVAIQTACAHGLAPEYLLKRGRGGQVLAQLTRSAVVEQLLPATKTPAQAGNEGARA